MQEAARRAVREFVARSDHRDRVAHAPLSDHGHPQRRLASARRVNEPVEFLDLDDVVGLAIALLGDPAPIRDIGLLGSAVGRRRRPRSARMPTRTSGPKRPRCCIRSSRTMPSSTETSASDGWPLLSSSK